VRSRTSEDDELSYSAWTGIFGRRGTTSDIISKLSRAAIEALANSAVRSRLAKLGFEALPNEKQTPGVLAAMQRADAQKTQTITRKR